VHELAGWLREAGINTCWLEGEMVQAKRNEAISRLTDGRINVLIATDVAARGIDIADVSHVFNFDLPRTADIYLHRIGRTGRAGKRERPSLWSKPTTICCWVKLAAILKSR
jgi:ATP-dependent RNA helicase SrmB